MKKFNSIVSTIFQLIYLSLSLIYVIGMPVLTIYKCTIEKIDIFSLASYITEVSLKLAIITFIIFVIDLIIHKDKLNMLLKRKVVFFFLFFLIWCSISTILSSNIYNSFFGISYRFDGLIEYVSYLSFAIIGFSLNTRNRKIYFRTFFIISIIIGLLTLFRNSFSWYQLPIQEDLCGIFININHYGYYLVYSIIISIFLFINDKNIIIKILDFIGYSFLILLLIINNTFGCYIAVLLTIVILLIYFIKNKLNKWLIIILFIPLIVLSGTIKDQENYVVANNFKELLSDINTIIFSKSKTLPIEDFDNQINYVGTFRGGLWIRGIKYALEKPLFGYGLDNLTDRYMKDYIEIDIPHNLIIQLAATVGFIGMLLYICPLIYILIKGLKYCSKEESLSLACYFVLTAHLISSMFGLTIYYVTPYFIIILGMAIKDLREKPTLQFINGESRSQVKQS